VESVDWLQCREFLGRLGLAFPTEAQWEYACRADAATRYAWGDDAQVLNGRENIADRSLDTVQGFTCAAWHDGHRVHAPVGSFAANAFGLFDMHGNVCEWTRDFYDARPGSFANAGDGLALAALGPKRMFRGGGWYTVPAFARASMRHGHQDLTKNATLGLRVVRSFVR
jgi:formylglycine-generating enzyme required for sulfatase activity